LTLALLALSYTGDRPKQWLRTKEKWIVLTLMGTLFLAISTALYVYYDAVRYREIVGLQGRYFIPIVILAVPVIDGLFKVKPQIYKGIAITLPVLLLGASVVTIAFRYYLGFQPF
jgi:uncharacterized membrane protein